MFKTLVRGTGSPVGTRAGQLFSFMALIVILLAGSMLAIYLAGRATWPAWATLAGYIGALLGSIIVAQGFRDLISWFAQKRRDIAAEHIFDALQAGQKAEPFVLYLRPFISTNQIAEERFELTRIRIGDQFHLAPSEERVEFEEDIEEAVRPVGRLVALGHPLEHIGAGRIRVSDDIWQSAIRTLIDEAALIVMLPSPRPGTSWEVNHVVESGALAKTILVDPPNERGSADSSYDAVSEWRGTREVFHSLGYDLPEDDPDGMLIWFGQSKSPEREAHLGLGGSNNLTAFARDVAKANERNRHA